MIVSIATAVLPVWRSPMISSRWPRPIGIIASMALRPVCSGSFTGWRSTTPGALNSSGRNSVVSIGGPPSSGLPSGSTTRPRNCSPTGTRMTWPVRRTVSPSLILSHSPKSTTATLSSSRFRARPVTSWGNSSISIETAFSSPYTRAMPSDSWMTVPTSSIPVGTSYFSICSRRIEVISSGLSLTSFLRGSRGPQSDEPCVVRVAGSRACRARTRRSAGREPAGRGRRRSAGRPCG